MSEYILLERKDLKKNRIIALPKQFFDERVEKAYSKVGSINEVTSLDFQKDEYWSHNFFNINCSPSMQNTEATDKYLIEQFDLLSENMDVFSLKKDKGLIQRIIGYQKVKGDIYLLRCSPEEKSRKDFLQGKNFCIAYFLMNEDNISFDFNLKKLRINGEEFEMGSDFGYLSFGQDSRKIISLDKIGQMEIHRSSLQSFSTRGTYGSSHENEPSIILREKPFEDYQLL